MPGPQVDTLETVLGFLQRPDVQEKAEEVARLFYSNGSVTINLLPILLFSFLGALRELQIIYCSLNPNWDALG